MRYVSLFSGIEAATVAWEPLGWEPVAFAEVDPFCSALGNSFAVPVVRWIGERIARVDSSLGLAG